MTPQPRLVINCKDLPLIHDGRYTCPYHVYMSWHARSKCKDWRARRLSKWLSKSQGSTRSRTITDKKWDQKPGSSPTISPLVVCRAHTGSSPIISPLVGCALFPNFKLPPLHTFLRVVVLIYILIGASSYIDYPWLPGVLWSRLNSFILIQDHLSYLNLAFSHGENPFNAMNLLVTSEPRCTRLSPIFIFSLKRKQGHFLGVSNRTHTWQKLHAYCKLVKGKGGGVRLIIIRQSATSSTPRNTRA